MSEVEYGHYTDDHWITELEACEWLKITRHTLYRLRRDGVLKSFVRIGKGPRASIRYSWRELRDAMQPSDKELWKLHETERKNKKVKRGTSAS